MKRTTYAACCAKYALFILIHGVITIGPTIQWSYYYLRLKTRVIVYQLTNDVRFDVFDRCKLEVIGLILARRYWSYTFYAIPSAFTNLMDAIKNLMGKKTPPTYMDGWSTERRRKSFNKLVFG